MTAWAFGQMVKFFLLAAPEPKPLVVLNALNASGGIMKYTCRSAVLYSARP